MISKFNVAIKFAAAALVLSTLACSTGTPTPSSGEVATMVASTLQALTPLASPTSQATVTSTSTATVAPTSTTAPGSNLPAATRLNFATGATQTVAEGNIQAAQTLHYVVRASKDQPMIVMFDTPEHDATLSVFGANGTVLLPQSQQTSSWQGILPATQDYYFRLTGGGSSEHFTLNVIIMARIQFAQGQNQVTLNGQTAGGYGVSYVAYALGGQTMHVTVNTNPEVAALTIWGFSDGQPYARAQNGVTDYSFTLPSTQDYVIEVVPQGGQVVNYQLKVKIQ